MQSSVRKEIFMCVLVELNVDFRLVPGDELKLSHPGDSAHEPWEALGHIIKLTAGSHVHVS
jgi:hypothetical protein